MQQLAQLFSDFKTMNIAEVVRDERVRDQFIRVYSQLHTQCDAEGIYEREAKYFNELLGKTAGLLECSARSAYIAFIDLAVKGLSLEQGAQATCYLLPRSVKRVIGGKDSWAKECYLTISAYGELYLRIRAGQVRHVDNPVIVYEGDIFQYGERDGHKFVNYTSSIPRMSNKILACFLKITRADGSIDYNVMTEADWSRLATYSGKNNAYRDKSGQYIERPNALYTSNDGQIDTGLLAAKCIKHAFRAYPKLRIGDGSLLESEVDTTAPAIDAEPDFDPYGTADAEPTPATPVAPTAPVAQPKGVTFTTDNDDTF